MDFADLDRLLHRFATRSRAIDLDPLLPELLQVLHAEQLDLLPLPGHGRTLDRWRALARVAGCDLGLAKLYEGHTDALAILAECGAAQHAHDGIWGMWAAEPPDARAHIVARHGERVQLQGRKAWCSGALQINWALLTAWENDQPQLVAVELSHPSQRIQAEQWQAVGMASTASVTVEFDNSPGLAIGTPGQYLSRPGFWQGGAGIAACWYGAAEALAGYLREHCNKPRPDPMPMPTWGRSMRPCTVPAPPFASAPRGSTSTPRTTPVLRYAAPAPRSSRRSNRSFSMLAEPLGLPPSAAAAISPGLAPTCRCTCARATLNATWPNWVSK